MKLRKMEALICPNCGASEFKTIRHDRLKFLKCEYCGTEYEAYEAHEEIKKPETLSDESVSGMMQTGEYVVYEHLNVSGMDNSVKLVDTASKNATHVNNLNVSGMDNKVRVKLMPGATKKVSGIRNQVG